MTRLTSQLEEMIQQQQQRVKSKQQKISTNIDSIKSVILENINTLFQQGMEQHSISQKERHAIVANIALANQSIIKKSEENSNTLNKLLQQSKKLRSNREKQNISVKASIEALNVTALENQAENIKALMALSTND